MIVISEMKIMNYNKNTHYTLNNHTFSRKSPVDGERHYFKGTLAGSDGSIVSEEAHFGKYWSILS